MNRTLPVMLALVTALAADGLDPDLEPARSALRAAGAEVEIVSWDDLTVDWKRFDATILRSTWDYADRIDEFRAWLDSTAEATRLVNSIDAIRWNIDKHYLAELAADGVPIVPTTFIEAAVKAGGVADVVDRLLADLDPSIEVFVVKPAIGAGSNGARRCTPDEVAAHVEVLHSAGLDAMVQPYVDMIDDLAETSLVYLGDGTSLFYDHAFSKQAILRSTDVAREGDLMAKEEIADRVASDAEQVLADAVLASSPVRALGPLAYARVDVVPTATGPVLMELELVEPSLYFASSAGSADRAARAWLHFVGTDPA